MKDRVIACVLEFKTTAASNCAQYATPTQPSEDTLNAAVAQINRNLRACNRNPSRDFVESFVLPHPVPLRRVLVDCSSNEWNFDTSNKSISCSFNNKLHMFGLCIDAHGRRAAAADVFPIVLNLPGNACDAPAFGGPSGVVFLHDDYLDTDKLASTILHEVGHGWSLNHASSTTGEYDDNSDPMGFGEADTCFNAPNSNRLGFATSIVEPLIVGRQGKHVWQPFVLPVFALPAAFKNHLIIVADDHASAVFLSLRAVVTRDGAAFDRGSKIVDMKNVLGQRITHLDKVSVHYVQKQGLMGHAGLDGDFKTFLIDTIPAAAATPWRSSLYFQSRDRPFVGAPFAIKFEMQRGAASGTVRICFMADPSQLPESVCRSSSVEGFCSASDAADAQRKHRSTPHAWQKDTPRWYSSWGLRREES